VINTLLKLKSSDLLHTSFQTIGQHISAFIKGHSTSEKDVHQHIWSLIVNLCRKIGGGGLSAMLPPELYIVPLNKGAIDFSTH
jgi:hypothetical protein